MSRVRGPRSAASGPTDAMRACETLSVPGTNDGVRRAVDAFDRFSRSQALPADARWRFLVALDEILSNILKHGSQGADAAIGLTFSLDHDIVSVAVVDGAAPFNPLLAPAADTTSPLETRRAGGLGIALVDSLMDQVAYERRGDHNHLMLSWRLKPEHGA